MATRLLAAVLCSLLAIPAARCDDDGFVPLFDGKTLEGWTTTDGKPVTAGWVVEDGTIHRTSRGGDIVSDREFDNFELRFEWKVAPNGNSGVKYRLVKQGRITFGCECQLLDDERHSNAKKAETSAGSLYQIAAPTKTKKLNPAGEWNATKIVANGPHLEHWLNGEKVLQVDVGSEAWRKAVEKSKYKNIKEFGTEHMSKILLQDHGNEVWFRDITIRPLDDADASGD